MANYNSFMVTEKTFHVSDVEAFRKAFEPLLTNARIHEEKDGTIWIGGYGAGMVVYDQDDNEVEIAEIIRKHIKAGDHAVIKVVGHEKLRYVSGVTYVISKKKVLSEGLGSMTDKLIEQLEE